MAVSDDLADAAIAHQIDLLRFDAGIRRRVVSLLQDMEREIVDRLTSGDALTDYSRERLNSQLAQIRASVDRYYTEMATMTAAEIQGLAQVTAAWQLQTINTAVGFELAQTISPESVLARLADQTLIMGAPQRDWWSRQSGDLQFRFTTALRMGVGTGETNRQIVARVKPLFDASEAQASALVRTSVQTVAGAARDDTFQANADIMAGKQQVSTLDTRTSDICMAYSGAVWDMENRPIRGNRLPWNGGPPRHFNCRSTVIPILKSFKELGIELPELPAARIRASMDGEVAAGLTFDDFLRKRSTAQQDEMLGVGRADLWRRGQITLTQLLDQRGNPLSLEQLRKKYGG